MLQGSDRGQICARHTTWRWDTRPITLALRIYR